MIRIMIISDRLMTEAVWKEPFHEAFSGRSIEFVTVDTEWPDQPFTSNQEIAEFQGSEDEICNRVGPAEFLVTHHGPVSRRVIEAARDIKAIGCCRTGPVNVNIDEATRRGIPVVYSPGHNSPAVAEFVLGLILVETKRIVYAHECLKKGIWRGDFYRYEDANWNLRQLTVGLIGFGAIGQAVYTLLRSFGTRVLVYDPYLDQEVRKRFPDIGFLELEQVLHDSDVVSLHARLTPDSHRMMATREFSLMKKGSYFINTARGGLMDYDALYDSLVSGHLAGAALDCFDEEPLSPESRLLALDNITVTPHIAGASKLSAHRAVESIVQDLRRMIDGQEIVNCYNPEALKHPKCRSIS